MLHTKVLSRLMVVVGMLIVMGLAACSSQGATSGTTDSAPAAENQDGKADAQEETADESTDEVGVTELSGRRTFVIIPEESTASYSVDEEFFADALTKYGIASGKTDTVGSTQVIEGQFELNFDDLSSALGQNEFRVDLSTLTSDQSLRDRWLRTFGPNFNSKPDAIFTANALTGAPDAYTPGEEVTFQLDGDLTIREITHPATFEVSATLEGDTITGVATATTLMSNFGIEPPDFANTLTVLDEFDILLEFTAREQ